MIVGFCFYKKNFIMQRLQSLISRLGTPQRISWGTHEGIRGAHWIDVQADGTIQKRRYLPNANATVESQKAGVVPEESFQELLAYLCSIPFEEMRAADQPDVSPSAYCITLECSWDQRSWRYVFYTTQQERQEIINPLAETFMRLAEQASANRDEHPE